MCIIIQNVTNGILLIYLYGYFNLINDLLLAYMNSGFE